MSNNNHTRNRTDILSSSELLEADQLLAKRQTVPDCASLERRILASTISSAKQNGVSESVSSIVPALKSLFGLLRLTPTMVASSVLVIALVSLQWPSITSRPADIVPDQTAVDAGRLEPGEEFSWDALWLIQDEIAFAEL